MIETEIEKQGKPVVINKPTFYVAYAKFIKKCAGSLETFIEWVKAQARNLFLMGKKAMKSGDLFKWGIGTLFSGKIFEQFWEKKGIFDVWMPKEDKEMPRKKENKLLPALTRESVLADAKSPLDGQVKGYLFDNLQEATYRSWFHDNLFIATGIRDGKLEFTAQCGEFTRNQIMEKFQDQLEKAFK